jgi:hypothetical protein
MPTSTARSFDISYDAVSNSVMLHCTDPAEDGGLNISLPASEGEGAKALKILQRMGLAPKDTEADKAVPKMAMLTDRDEEVYQYTCKKLEAGYKGMQAVPVGVKKGDKIVCLNFATGVSPNTMVVTNDGEERDKFVRNIVRYNNRFTHAFETVIYSKEVGKHHKSMGMELLFNEFEFLLFLRNIASMESRNTDRKRVIIIEDFAELVEGRNISSDSASERTAKAVRAEILSLIQDLSRQNEKGQAGWFTHFVFCLDSINAKDYNAFLPTTDTRIAIGEVGTSTYKLFSKNVNPFSAWGKGRAYFQQKDAEGLFQI